MQVLKPRRLIFYKANMSPVVDIEQYPENQRINRLEMLAELYYVEASLRVPPFSEQLYNQAYLLFRYIDTHSGVYSIERKEKIAEIEQKLKIEST